MELISNSDEVLNTVRSIVYHLNDVNLAKMTPKMIALPINNVKLLEEITDIIFDRALKRQNYTHVYAQMCACMINDSKFNKLATDTKTTFQKVLLKKCSDVFYIEYQQELNQLKKKMKNDNMVPKRCISTLNNFQFDFNKKSICNCRFIGELFKNGAFPEKVILSCITDLSKENNENNELQMHCLCTILQLVGPILSKTYDLNKLVNKLVSSLNNHGMPSTLKCLIHQVKRMHSKGWKNEEPVNFIGNNYTVFSDLPIHMKSVYRLKSIMIMAEWIYDESHDVLFNFVNKNKIDEVMQLLQISNTWIFYDPVLFVVSIILVALEENQIVRNHAGKLLNNLNKKKKLSTHSIQSGVNKVLNDSGTKKEYPNLSNLVSDITGQSKL
ncbi:eukaryotic translation initiation factor 4 gamma 1-like isoform X2 [Metopolophium dirhodum]|nr:eukaryotic translation initiation factor 4 gamma 1-like isoform X2 [Metopolophium dirhodum]XP_060862188.1 eukaryotic translation initiation factor 4 gamma 1-like isoform X2 [Metopolophium dirhodum]XP_060862189.1 eukaryotic translation initiation factor 4 gamma 1-like isoform X2 [Metopolophium dirhodum]XP_060862190.1 eukaryotic translation initiation factor 4 gamma 1-like isoform X2 [Metopolophium dirhodum]